MQAAHAGTYPSGQPVTFVDRLNGEWHEPALRIFMVIVLAHWAEHLTQAFQIYALGWPVPESRGVLGHFFPWIIKSETLHYGYALVMLVGLCRCCGRGSPARSSGDGGRSRWRSSSFTTSSTALLQTQSLLGHNLFDRPVPTSIVQLWVPRVELHLFYNTIVFIPMVIAMYLPSLPGASPPRRRNAAARGIGERALRLDIGSRQRLQRFFAAILDARRVSAAVACGRPVAPAEDVRRRVEGACPRRRPSRETRSRRFESSIASVNRCAARGSGSKLT